MNAALQNLKSELGQLLLRPDQLSRHEGLPTGLKALDQYLWTQGLPKGALTLFRGAAGFGATSLWMQTAAQVTGQKKWVAWINGEIPLYPIPFVHLGVDFNHLLMVSRPKDLARTLWLLQELMSSGLFELIGCDLGTELIRSHQAKKLQTLARSSQTALVFMQSIDQGTRPSLARRLASDFQLVVRFQSRQLSVEHTQHRPTPFHLPRRLSYASFTAHSTLGLITSSRISEKATGDQTLHSRTEPRALFEIPTDFVKRSAIG